MGIKGDMMRVLLLGPINSKNEGFHYSDSVTPELQKAFTNIGHECNMLYGKNVSSTDFNSYHIIMLAREQYAKRWLSEYSLLTNIIFHRTSKREMFPIICARYGNHRTISSIYANVNEFYDSWDFHFVQTLGFAKEFVCSLSNGDTAGKICVSDMAVPSVIQKVKPIEMDSLIYMGRLRHNPSRYDFIKSVMTESNLNLKLNVFPGSFSKDDDKNKYGSDNPDNIEWLKKRLEHPNITVHPPVNWGKHWAYLMGSSYGFDLSPRFRNRGYSGGNAKLLEYMRAGLPTVTEPGTTNSNLLSLCNGGIIAKKSYCVESYCEALEQLVGTLWNREEIKRRVIETNSWEVRVKEMINNMSIVMDINLNELE